MKDRYWFTLVLVSILVAACGQFSSLQSVLITSISSSSVAASPAPAAVQTRPIENFGRLFNYDRYSPLDIQETNIEDSKGVRIHDLTFASPGGDRIKALLVTPPGTGPFAGIIFVHSGEGDRTQFLEEAEEFARNGALGLLVEIHNSYQGNHEDRDQFIKNIIALRCGIDLLTARAYVDPQRIGYIGFGSGADMGEVLAGMDKRIRAYVFMSGTGRRSNNLKGLFSLDSTKETQFIGSMAQLDAIHFIHNAAPASLFFQNGLHDQYIPQEEAKELQEAAGEPKWIKWYDAYHELNGEAKADRAVWMAAQLNLIQSK